MTFSEKNELRKLDKEAPALEKKKEELLAKIAAGGTDHHAMIALRRPGEGREEAR